MVNSDDNIVDDPHLQALLHTFNDTTYPYPVHQTIHELFEQQVDLSMDTIAVTHLEYSITYSKLNQRANQLARYLQKQGVGPNTIVALIVDRSIAMFIGILGILKTGAAYLPIDPEFPAARITHMVTDATITHMLIQGPPIDAVTFSGVTIDLADSQLYRGDSANLSLSVTSNALMYVIYTSGSTGQPKGVMIEHRAVHNFIRGVTAQIHFSQGKTIVCLTTISFDIFVLESMLPLCQGLTCVIAHPLQFTSDLGGRPIDMVQTTPSTMSMLLQNPTCIPYIQGCREIMLGGEPLPTALLHRLRKLTRARLYNMYGPTETTVWSTIQEVTTTAEITIGRPIANSHIYILDEQDQPIYPDTVGHLCIAGDGVARGYLHKPDLTALKFAPNPFVETLTSVAPGERLYKTGDRASWLADGQIVFWGRGDLQVKIRGFRIELGEIEDQLGNYPHLHECAVVAKLNEREEAYLVAYYVADTDLTASTLIDFLAQTLPTYMIPGIYMRLAQLPRTPNAKLDRKALPSPDKRRPALDSYYIAPQTDLEQQLATIWRLVLQCDEIGIHDNFFALGGNSVLLAQMMLEINQLQLNHLRITDIFAAPTIAQLTSLLQTSVTMNPTDTVVKTVPSQPPNTLPDQLYWSSLLDVLQTDAHMRNTSLRWLTPQTYQDPIAFIFPGQGTQYVGMGARLYQQYAIVRDLFEQASDTLQFDLRKVCFAGSLQELTQTEKTQPAILTVSVAASRVLIDAYGVIPTMVAGHSLGEIAALVCAEVISLTDAVRLVTIRGTAMQAAAAQCNGAMFAISHVPSSLVQHECSRYAHDDAIVSISNYNTPDQVVISGQREALVSVGRALQSQGASVLELNVSAPFHCSLMQPAVESFRTAAAQITFKPPKYPIISNVTAAPYTHHTDIAKLLATHIVAPVRWYESITCLANLGIKTLIDIGPGNILRNLVTRTHPYLATFSFDQTVGVGQGSPTEDDHPTYNDERTSRYAFMKRCLSIALCTPNYTVDDQAAGELVTYHQATKVLLEHLHHTDQLPDFIHLHQALDMLMSTFQVRHTPPEEQMERLTELIHSEVMPESLRQYLLTSRA